MTARNCSLRAAALVDEPGLGPFPAGQKVVPIFVSMHRHDEVERPLALNTEMLTKPTRDLLCAVRWGELYNHDESLRR